MPWKETSAMNQKIQLIADWLSGDYRKSEQLSIFGANLSEGLAPLQGANSKLTDFPVVCAALRPPATFWQPFGLLQVFNNFGRPIAVGLVKYMDAVKTVSQNRGSLGHLARAVYE